VATCALQRLGLSDRIAQCLPFRTHPLQGHLAITGRSGEPALKKIFESIDIRSRYGKVTLVGFGPGNPDLITVAGERVLKEADAILYDDLLDADYLSNFTGEKIYVGKRNGNHSIAQEEINRKLAELAFDGKRTVRLKGGDAMIFAHGREEIDYLQSVFIDVSVIPGVTAANALAAYSHIPLTHRGVSSSVALVSAHSTLGIQVPNAHTLVYYMGGTKLKEIAKALLKEGRDPMSAVALAYNVSRPDQKFYYLHLYELEHLVMRIPTPILAIIGDVVLLEHDLSQDPILVTATDATKYVELGKITHTPLIRIEPIDFSMPDYKAFDWIIFTSRYGVRQFLDRLKNDISELSNIRICSVGPSTTLKLSEYGIEPDFESPTSDADGIIRYFKENKISDKQILLPRSAIGIKTLKEELTALNNQVLDLPVYETIMNEKAEKVDLSKFSRIYFASPSAVEAFINIYGEIPQSIPCIASGTTTENSLISKI
jgi:uroporphyrinogen III methyltransferase/synthase